MVTLIRAVDNLGIFPTLVLNRSNRNPDIVRFNNLELTIKAIPALEHYGIQSFAFLIVNSSMTLGNFRKLEKASISCKSDST